MSKAKFTKGPWSYDKLTGLVSGNDIEQDIICDTMTTGEQWEEANASLIACAPEMYEMLEYVMGCAAMQDNQLIDANKIMALLAKARGEHETKD